MTDRELLELAAKAAGMKVHARHQAGRDACGAGDVGLWISNETTCWNPLLDVGDATRLLLALKLRVDYVDDQPCIEGVLQSGMTAEESFCRAVVRAAAAMGGAE